MTGSVKGVRKSVPRTLSADGGIVSKQISDQTKKINEFELGFHEIECWQAGNVKRGILRSGTLQYKQRGSNGWEAERRLP